MNEPSARKSGFLGTAAGRRIRPAACALLIMFPGLAPVQAQLHAPENRIVLDLDTSPANPRNSEGAFVALRDGRLMFVYTRFTGGGDDNAAADLAAVYSADGGLTWSRPEVIVKNDAAENVMSDSLLRLADGRIALFYLRKNGLADCRLWMRLSSDEARTWGPATLAIPAPGYFVVNNDRIIQLSTGRLVAPAAFHRLKGEDTADMKNFDPRAIALFFLSDDAGRTWRESASWWALPCPTRTGLQEPGAIELEDGTLYGWCRTDQGAQYEMTSRDGGDTWTAPGPSPFKSPNSPLSMKRIPGTGDLLAVWNDHSGRFPFPTDHALYGGRTPLVSAVSRDEGKSWGHFKEVEADPRSGYCYVAIDFLGKHAFLAYWMAESKGGATVTRLRIRRIGLDWLTD
jgi:sialidase-1